MLKFYILTEELIFYSYSWAYVALLWVYLGSFWFVSDVSLAEEDDAGKISIPSVLFAHLRGSSGIAWTMVPKSEQSRHRMS